MKNFDKDMLKKTLDIVEKETIENEDMAYWLYHRNRYQNAVQSILKEFESRDLSKIRILDIGFKNSLVSRFHRNQEFHRIRGQNKSSRTETEK